MHRLAPTLSGPSNPGVEDSSNTVLLPEALVLRWNHASLRVRCPYCLRSHSHGYGHVDDEEGTDQTQPGWKLRGTTRRRHGDCLSGGEYIFTFPPTYSSDDVDYGWMFDRDNFEFVAMTQQGPVPIPINELRDGRTLLPQHQQREQMTSVSDDSDSTTSETDELIAATGTLNITSDKSGKASEAPSTKDSQAIFDELCESKDYRLDLYFSHCIWKDIDQLRILFSKYPDDRFIDCTDEEGNTGVILAAVEEGGLGTLRWLQDHGGDIDQSNHYGRTPLMEAALWGRLETVQYLTSRVANLVARDGSSMRAVDLATDTARNRNERLYRAGKVYREPADAVRQREQIKAVLDRLTRPAVVSSGPALQRRAFFSRNLDGTLELYRPQVLLSPPGGQGGQYKAFATLDRGPSYPYINAMSGYTHAGWPNVLDNTVWTDVAEKLRAMLRLPPDRRAACHVEPQLLGFLVHHHSIQYLEDTGANSKLKGLASVKPDYTLNPIITVSKQDLCGQCLEFFELFKTRFSNCNVVFHCVGDSASAVLQERR
ncbi:hypothetical protein BAUCODRAFT_428189 [Baudoinia panamericana UAMH 10762]|uniref:Uncharacterized protein n=1 Tax=Baudoinia panamericana (strain UAMH 10762) TaxID=717646 RepID=M2LV70_BAUPA|nr:uncharacterized protein BAUCODRAFT_428189 [Baudoinia panamericana UAMH 10762]EMC98497.1 hypothetical protein BAUCODRAFT_428189 [Baudoinia panamericana UAMH 10762]